MRILEAVLICIFLFQFINSECLVDEDALVKIRDDDDCEKRSFSDEEKEEGAYKCCLVKMKVDSYTFKGKEYSCVPLTQAEYKDIKKYIKAAEKINEVKDLDIDCNSSYLAFSFIITLVLIFF